jgi:hypothetical protein
MPETIGAPPPRAVIRLGRIIESGATGAILRAPAAVPGVADVGEPVAAGGREALASK